MGNHSALVDSLERVGSFLKAISKTSRSALSWRCDHERCVGRSGSSQSSVTISIKNDGRDVCHFHPVAGVRHMATSFDRQNVVPRIILDDNLLRNGAWLKRGGRLRAISVSFGAAAKTFGSALEAVLKICTAKF